MAVIKRKVKRYVIDVNSYVTLFLNKETDWLLRYINQNNIEIFVDDKLISELKRVLEYPKIKKNLTLSSLFYINFVSAISTHIAPKLFHFQSPDPEDDYLYDIALSAHAKLLVTGERALLNWVNSPVETISLSLFRKLF